MERSLHLSAAQASFGSHSTVSTAGAASRQAVPTTAVGASYAFDPGIDGLASIYAARVLERGLDPRVLCAEIRADRLGLVDRGPQRRALMVRTRSSRFGRGTAAHLRSRTSLDQPSRPVLTALEKETDRAANQLTSSRPRFQLNWSRKLAAAGLAALLLLPLVIVAAHAQNATLQEDEGAHLLAPGLQIVTVYGHDDAEVYVPSTGHGNFD